MRTFIATVTLLQFLICTAIADFSPDNHKWNEAGVRVGIQVGPEHEYFHLYDIFAVRSLPWEWRPSADWMVDSQLNTSLGALHTGAETGIKGSLGTGIKLHKTGLNFFPEIGISVDLLNRRHFGSQDFGSILLFGAYLGLNYRFDNGFGVGYRINHLSNGHIFYHSGIPNPGVDMHSISASWRF